MKLGKIYGTNGESQIIDIKSKYEEDEEDEDDKTEAY